MRHTSLALRAYLCSSAALKAVAIIPLIVFSATLLSSPSAHANSIALLNWAPAPDGGPAFPEILWNEANMATGPGAQSSSDGNLPLAAQAPGGLFSNTIVNAPAPYSFPSGGGTGYYDTTLVFSGLAPSAFATSSPLGGGFFLDSQLLGPGTFTLYSTSVLPGPVVLLQGTIANAVITGLDGGGAGAVIDASGITYTGGAVFGGVSWQLANVGKQYVDFAHGAIPNFSIDGGSGYLNAFQADATGEFDVFVTGVPEPSTLTLGAFGLAGVFTLLRRRTKNV